MKCIWHCDGIGVVKQMSTVLLLRVKLSFSYQKHAPVQNRTCLPVIIFFLTNKPSELSHMVSCDVLLDFNDLCYIVSIYSIFFLGVDRIHQVPLDFYYK